MFEDIQKNKRKTGLIIFVFVLLVSLIVYYIGMAFDLGYFSIVIALLVSIASAWGSYYNSDKIVLRLNHARPATAEENQKLLNILDGLLVACGLSVKPQLYIMEESQPNAFATGRNPEHSVICVTTGLLEKLDYYETEGVLAHELAHIRNYDIRLSAVVSVMVGLIVILSDFVSRTLFWRRSSDNEKGNPILMIIGLVCVLLAPLFGTLMKLALSRRREFLADSTAIGFTRNPDALISALTKISSDSDELEVANNATSNMYIVNPFRGDKKKKSNLFSTHPSTQDRIEAIRHIQ